MTMPPSIVPEAAAPATRRRVLRGLISVLLVAFLLNIAVTLLLSATVDPFAGAMTSMSSTGGTGREVDGDALR